MPEIDETKISQRLFQRAIHFLSYRARSEQEIRDYLKRKLQKRSDSQQLNHGIIVSSVMAKLADYSLLNDTEFAASWIRDRLGKGKGARVIEQELRRKGVAAEIINGQLKNLDQNNVTESAKKIVTKKLLLWKDEPLLKQKQKAFRLLLSRGFPLEVARRVIDATLKSVVK